MDLNQIRAGLADSLEDARHSAVRQRILAAKEREAAPCLTMSTRGPDMSGDFSLVHARTLASRIVTERGEPIAMPAAESDQLDATGLHAALARWGINPAAWLAQFQHLDRQCTRALGTAERVLRRAREAAQQRFHGISFCRAVFATAPSDGFT